MKRKWMAKLSIPIVALMLTVACNTMNDEDEPQDQPGTEQPGENNQDNQPAPENERYEQNRNQNPDRNQNQNPNNMDSDDIDFNYDKYEGHQ